MRAKKEENSGSSTTKLEEQLAAISSELSRKNRDLEIEASLERVRAVAMGMNQSDDLLRICETMFHELKKLGFDDLRNAMIDIHYEAKEYLLNYDYSDNAGKTITTFKYNSHPIVDNLIYHAKQSSEAFTEMVYSGKALDDWRIFRKQNGEADDARLDNIDALYYYFYSIGTGAIGISTFSAANPEQLNVLKRFRNVFDLAYRRYTDIQMAENQAREAQIELALERVRARTMAMQHSDELVDAAAILFKQVKDLSVEVWTCGFQIWKPGEPGTTIAYMTLPDGTIRVPFDIPHPPEPFLNRAYEAAERGDQFYVEELGGDALAAHYKYMLALPGSSDRMADISAGGFDLPEFQVNHNAYFPNGSLLFITYKPVPESWDIFKRFAKVFEQTYTRFLDLKKAEAQAREGQIELALERVRARTMAMQHSDELAETAYILFQQFRELGENPDQATIGIINEAEGVIEYWVTIHGNQTNKVFKFPVDEPNVTRKIYNAWKAQEKSLVIDLSGQALYDFSKFRESMGGAGYNEAEQRRIINVAFLSKGLINVQSTVERSIESLRLLERFANVFDGTYTRFLDLEKAEAQAREAQIELALERVRARAMAMQDSKELSGMVSTVFDELTKLDFALTRCAIVIADSESGSWMIWMANSELGQPPISFYRKSLDHPYPNAANEEWKKKTPKWVYHLKGAEKKGMDDYYANSEEVAHVSNEIRQAMGTPDSIILSHSFNNFGYLRADSLEPLSEANLDILYRFAKVFDLGYTRFTDIKQAEAQAREAQIELALERVRAKTMAMQRSDELLETSQVVFQQLRDLGETADQIGIAIVKEDEGVFDLFATLHGTQMVRVFQPKIDDPFVMGRVYKNWKAHKRSFVVELGGEQLRQYNILRNQLGGQIYYNENIGADDRWTVCCASFSRGILSFSSSKEPTKEAAQLLERFAKVFDSTYTRFLDLQKAEAQARESQIQLALERVRARTMAMQKSDELAETVSLVFKQLLALGIRTEQIRTCGIVTFNDNEPIGEQWITETNGDIIPQSFTVPYNEAPAYKSIYKAWKDGEKFMVIHLESKALKEHLGYLAKGTTVPTRDVVLPQQAKEIFNHVLFFSQGCLFIITKEALPEYHDIFKRFGAVFQQSYTRFLDLQKAEAQAKESQIQLAMERVRAKTMAMHNSDDVADTVITMFDELVKLGIEKTARCGIAIIDDNREMELWRASYNADGNIDRVIGRIDMTIHPLLAGVYQAWKNNEAVFSWELTGKDQEDYFRALSDSPEYPVQFDLASLPAKQINSVFFFPEGCVYVFTIEPLAPGAVKLFKRFAGVFGLTYRRYLDLKKAEAQARESQIELALERVRARTMAMQKSDELQEIIKVVYEQLVHLNILVEHAGFIMDYNTRDDMHIWLADQHYAPTEITVPYFDSPHWNGFNEAKEKGKDFFAIHSTFEEKNKFYQDLFKLVPGATDETKEYYFSCPGLAISTVLLENVSLYIENFAGKPYTDDENATLMRFGKVFQQTYTRFLDLQRAEAQAREAVKQASLDRVRGEIASMRTTTDLERITPLIWNELTILGIPFIRCGVFIVDEAAELIHTHLSTPDGKALAAFDLPFDSEGIGQNVLSAWRKKQSAVIHWTAEEFAANTKSQVERGAVKARERFVTEHPDTSLDLHFFPFLQGMLYAGNTEPLNDDAKDLVQSLAEAFSTAYARYEDFNKLEAAKQQVDKTLTDLKAAQAQLIQTEKMASLGELTAGIAHEIQNPLNFVNNFSEVNAELIEEMKAEIEKGDLEEIKALALDIEENSKKINQHGKRADGIVKGMLQHSQSGSGVKELTNINSVADEYMRLAYHGLRAKDKSFNAEMHTHFDAGLPKINVIPQDIGRVLLNLFNNAFYAVNKKQKTAGAGYRPEITVTTAPQPPPAGGGAKAVVVTVKDNGIGIPDAIKEKIMQPFFTTKPTGEGTGLGLSLTYDMVVKGHGGSIKVNSVEGEGSEFIITLPIN